MEDNLLAINEERPFWTSEIWDFDAQFSDAFFGIRKLFNIMKGM